jgi:hypothetical protein
LNGILYVSCLGLTTFAWAEYLALVWLVMSYWRITYVVDQLAGDSPGNHGNQGGL